MSNTPQLSGRAVCVLIALNALVSATLSNVTKADETIVVTGTSHEFFAQRGIQNNTNITPSYRVQTASGQKLRNDPDLWTGKFYGVSSRLQQDFKRGGTFCVQTNGYDTKWPLTENILVIRHKGPC